MESIICQSIQSFTETICEQTIAKKVESIIAEECGSLNHETLLKIREACNPGDLFEGLHKRWLREKYDEKHFNYTVRV